MPACGRPDVRRGCCRRAATAAACSRRPTAAITGRRSRAIQDCPPASGADIGLTISGANSNRLWAIIEADSGGVYRTDDAGKTWTRTNNDRNLRQRAWYYTKIHADPKDTNVVYDNNVSFQKSIDGGKTFRPVRGLPHGDSHDLWIDPKNSNRMIESDDGGSTVSVDGGKTWSDEDFATAQFYHVITTTHFPYHICGAQQDNSTLCGPSRGSLDISDWLEAGGGESGWIAPRNDDPDIVYAGSYGNLLTRKDLRTGITVNVNPWPDNPMGHPAMDLKYRFQWTFPITVSKHNSNVVYAGSNVVHKTTNGGKSWTVISPDLTYHDPATLGNSGGPITKDQTSVEYYATIFIIEESPITPNTIWTGSDDGKVYRHAQRRREVERRHAEGHGEIHARLEHRRVEVRRVHRVRRRESLSARRRSAVSLEDDATAARTGRASTPASRRPSSRASCAKIPASADCSSPARSAACGSRRTTARTGRACASICRSCRCTISSFKQGDIVLATHGRGFYIMDDISTLEQMSDAIVAIVGASLQAARSISTRDGRRIRRRRRRRRRASRRHAGKRTDSSDGPESADGCRRAVLARLGERGRRHSSSSTRPESWFAATAASRTRRRRRRPRRALTTSSGRRRHRASRTSAA